MNVENENIEPVTELGLAFGSSSQCNQRRSNSDSGAGANAGSRVDTKFVAADHLTELVWSPQNGLSLKCADSSFFDKKNSFLWGSGSSNKVLSPALSITAGRSSTDKPINEENFMKSQGAFHLSNETADRNTSSRTPGSDVAFIADSGSSHEDRTGNRCYVQETNTVIGLSLQRINGKEEISNGKEECIAGPNNNQMAEISEAKEKIFMSFPADLRPDLAQNEPLSEDPTAGGKDVGSGNQASRMEIILAPGFRLTKDSEANNTFMQNLTSPGKRCEESASFLERKSGNKMTTKNSLTVHPLEKLESTSENDLQNLFSKNVPGAASRIVASESAHEIKNRSWQGEETLPKEKTISNERSLPNSRIRRYRRKGKEKALSEGEVNGKMSKEDDDSHESVESCNSAGLLSTGKKRWSFDQQLIVGSKKVKKQIQECPGSTSFIKQDSSFMNWISNMMKGFSKSNIDDTPAPSLALTLAHPTHGHEIPDQQLIMCNKNQESRCRNVGFQSIFQSLYRPKTKGHQRALDDDYQRHFEVTNGLCDINATPLACHSDNDNVRQQFLLSNEKINKSASREGAGMATQPKISSANFASSQENTRSAENKNSCNLGTDKGEGGANSNSSMGKRKISITENIDSEPPFKVRTNYNLVHGSDRLGSLWITRFAPRTSFPLLSLDNQNQSSDGPFECSTSCQKNIPCSWNPISSSNDLKIVEAGPHPSEDQPVAGGNELQNCAAETEFSTGFNGIRGHNDQKSICKLNLITPSSRLKNSEAMASNFAKRLDALKHIMQPDVTDSAACAAISCFFCDRKSHHLRECSEITGGELEDLLKNINSCNGAEDLPCLCIRRFQLNHWAVASSRGENQLEDNDFSPNEMQLNRRNEQSTKLLDGSAEKKLRENQTIPCSNFFLRHISGMPEGIFDFIKRLRLSRTDILKLMNSHMSLAHLHGFFLRLRLGKWQEGLGGTGYYVACITGAQKENSQQNSKNSISVNVGGIKCMVESRYISNHDFLEDELKAWWSATQKSGGKIPSEEDLRLKIEERKMLGM